MVRASNGPGAADGTAPSMEREKLWCLGPWLLSDFSGLRVEPQLVRWTLPGSRGGWMLWCAFLLPVVPPRSPRGFARRSLSRADAGSLRSARRRRASVRGHLPASPVYLTLACQLRLSNPGLGLLGQFPLHPLNPRLLRSRKSFGVAHPVSEIPPGRLGCSGLAPGRLESCRRAPSPAQGEGWRGFQPAGGKAGPQAPLHLLRRLCGRPQRAGLLGLRSLTREHGIPRKQLGMPFSPLFSSLCC